MPNKKLERYNLEKGAKISITVGLLLLLVSWIISLIYVNTALTSKDRLALFLIPSIFTAVDIILLLVIKYRYTLFEKYPYLINLPSVFYHLSEKKSVKKQSIAFNMIFTVHSLVIAFLGLLSILLVLSIGSSSKVNSPFFYSYFIVIAILVISVLLIYRRIYINLKE